jgi:hypothetical protein
MKTTIGIKVAPFGVTEPKEIVNPLPGKMRIRMRNEDFPRAYFKTETGIRSFIISLADDGERWAIDERLEQGRNERSQSP